MKKHITILTTILLLGWIRCTHAADELKISFQNPLKSDSIKDVLTSFFDIIIELGAIAVTLAIIYSGFLFVMAQGKPEDLKKARTIFYWTIIGGLVLLGAQVISSIIQTTIKQL